MSATSEAQWSDTFAIGSRILRKLLPKVFIRCGFVDVQIDDEATIATARRQNKRNDHFRSEGELTAIIEWRPLSSSPSGTRVSCDVFDFSGGGQQSASHEAGSIGAVLQKTVVEWEADEHVRKREAPPHNPIAPPGRPFEGIFTGSLLDYSGCATEGEVRKLTDGVLPLGRYTFGFEPNEEDEAGNLTASVPPIGRSARGFAASPVVCGPQLYLSRFRNKGRMEYNGVLVCAPQNSGKTQLIVRWAKAAAQATDPYGVFVVDVKGNLWQRLKGKLPGDTYYFSTDPNAKDSDCINFLAGPKGLTPAESDRIRQLVTALLPSRGWTEKGGEDEFFYRNRVIWLTAFVHLLKLAQFYLPDWFKDSAGKHRDVDLGDLYDLISSEERVCSYIEMLKIEEQARVDRNQQVPECGVKHWTSEMLILLDPEKVVGGQRPKDETYRALTTGILSALEPFSRHGTLSQRVSSAGNGRLFSLEEVLGDKRRRATVFFAARHQDLETSAAVLSMAIKRLQWFLFDRMRLAEEQTRPVLLLLDETRRIEDFDAAEYITFAREAKAGCVVVYQSLDQIGDPAKITEILENVGTQIYLGSLVGNTARYFTGILPRRWRPAVSQQTARAPNTETTTTSVARELVDYFSTTDLYHLPAGRWPALVYINDLPRRKPILVDMTDPNPEELVEPGAELSPRTIPASPTDKLRQEFVVEAPPRPLPSMPEGKGPVGNAP